MNLNEEFDRAIQAGNTSGILSLDEIVRFQAVIREYVKSRNVEHVHSTFITPVDMLFVYMSVCQLLQDETEVLKNVTFYMAPQNGISTFSSESLTAIGEAEGEREPWIIAYKRGNPADMRVMVKRAFEAKDW